MLCTYGYNALQWLTQRHDLATFHICFIASWVDMCCLYDRSCLSRIADTVYQNRAVDAADQLAAAAAAILSSAQEQLVHLRILAFTENIRRLFAYSQSVHQDNKYPVYQP